MLSSIYSRKIKLISHLLDLKTLSIPIFLFIYIICNLVASYLYLQYHYYPSFLKISEPGRSILSSSHSKRARRSLTSRGIQFADASGRPLTNTREISRWITPADRQMWLKQCAYSSKRTLCEEGNFPRSTENCPPHTSYSHWLNSSDATTIAGGKHRGRLGYILQYSQCNQYLKVVLVSPDPEFYLHEPVIVKRKHIYSSAPGSLTPTTKPQKNEDQCVDSDIADDDSLCNFVAEDDDYQLEDEEEEEEDDPAPATITGRKHQCPFVLKGPPTKRRRVAVAIPPPTKSKQEIPALAFKVEQYVTVAGGKYAGQKCIILKHLARRVSIQLVDSGLVTCISRRSLGLDEEKTVWHAKPRRSPRIKAMMEASEKSCDDMDGGNP